MKQRVFLFIALVMLAITSHAEELSVAERNAAQGFNDTIDRLAPDFVTVSLVVCDPSDVLYSTLGHAALHLQCPTFDLDYIFSYESENVREKIWTFLRGKLKMGMFALSPEEFLQGYKDDGRGVKEYRLNLSPAQKQKLWEVMDKHVMEGANLPYDYFNRGCAKSVVIVMHEAIGKQAIHYAPWSDKYKKQTQRELVRDFITEAPWEEFYMYFLIGVEGDKSYPCEKKLIIPSDLVEVWQQATFDNGDNVLDSNAHVLLEPTTQLKAGPFKPMPVCMILLILSIVSLATIRMSHPACRLAGTITDYAVLTISGIAGIVMTYLIVFSSLPCTRWNWLIIPFNILPAIGWYWRKYWALPYAVIILIWCIVMAWQWMFGHILVDWAHIILAMTLGITLLKQAFKQ